MSHRRTSPIDRMRSNWRRLWGEPIGWVWLSAFLLHLVALFCVQDFVFFKGMSVDEHGVFIAQSMRFSVSEKKELNISREVQISPEQVELNSKSIRPSPEKKLNEEKIVDVPQWNPLNKISGALPSTESKEEGEVAIGAAGVKIWELKSPVKKVVFLIDVSGTMWNEIEGRWGFQVAQEEVIRCVKAMPPEMFFNVIYYSDSTAIMTSNLVAATPENKEMARRFLNMKPNLSGATDFFKGIQSAFQQRPQSIFIFTDGEMDIPRWKILSQMDSLKEEMRQSIPIFGIGFFYEKNQESLDLLQKICFSTGGDFKLYLNYSVPVKIEKKPSIR